MTHVHIVEILQRTLSFICHFLVYIHKLESLQEFARGRRIRIYVDLKINKRGRNYQISMRCYDFELKEKKGEGIEGLRKSKNINFEKKIIRGQTNFSGNPICKRDRSKKFLNDLKN